MKISIDKIGPKQIPVLIAMLREFAAFEQLTEYCTVTEDRLQEAMFGENAVVEGLIASDGQNAIGYAIFYLSFSSFRGERGIFLEDIYVRDEYRGKSVGQSLLTEIARIAASRGFERIDFQVLNWNTKAIGFYENLGAVRNDDERHFKFSGDAFTMLAS